MYTNNTAVILANSDSAVGLPKAIETLLADRSSLDVVEEGIRVVEADPTVRTVGLGGAPNILGEMQLDASIMCGDSRLSGAVGALQGYVHPISVARRVTEKLPHVFLVGLGAVRFAAEIGAEAGETLSNDAKADYEEWISKNMSLEKRNHIGNLPLSEFAWPKDKKHRTHGTSVFLVRNAAGSMAGGASTSGWNYAYPGRLGDSPVIGAGLYVDSRYGAAACTHTGEMTIRAGTARSVVAYMKKGASVADACGEALEDLDSMTDGYIGPVVLHAMDKDGEIYVTSLGDDSEDGYWCWRSGMNTAECGQRVKVFQMTNK